MLKTTTLRLKLSKEDKFYNVACVIYTFVGWVCYNSCLCSHIFLLGVHFSFTTFTVLCRKMPQDFLFRVRLTLWPFHYYSVNVYQKNCNFRPKLPFPGCYLSTACKLQPKCPKCSLYHEYCIFLHIRCKHFKLKISIFASINHNNFFDNQRTMKNRNQQSGLKSTNHNAWTSLFEPAELNFWRPAMVTDGSEKCNW